MTVVCALMSASMQAQQSIGEALRRAHALPASLEAQGLPEPPSSLEDALHSLYQRAQVVFTGEVTSVERTGDAVVVTFRVEDGIRGAASGSSYALREWAGLWADDPARYVVGERRLMLLHANSVCGFASPAGGVSGAIRLHGDAVQGTADLRWVAAQVASTRTAPMASAFTLSASNTTEGSAVPENSALDGAMVTAMLHAWHRVETVQ